MAYYSLQATLPTSIPRPDKIISAGVPVENLRACDPSLATLPEQFITAILDLVRHAMFRGVRDARPLLGVSSTQLPEQIQIAMPVASNIQGLPSTQVPREMEVHIRAPTHMLALHSTERSGAHATPTLVSFVPAHGLILATTCSKISPEALRFPASLPTVSSTDTQIITLPVLPINIPSVPTFRILLAYLYTKASDILLSELLRQLPPPAAYADTPLSSRTNCAIPSPLPSLKDLLPVMQRILGVWRNGCALGVIDNGFWDILDCAWQQVTAAVAATQRVQRKHALARARREQANVRFGKKLIAMH